MTPWVAILTSAASHLKNGDKVLLSNGNYGIIQTVNVERLEIPENTYNFEVEDFHTYYVGENSVCVHNECWTTKKRIIEKMKPNF